MADFDLIIIGGGPGGYTAAIRGAQLGMKVAVVEKKKLGGTCLNEGCIPAKALIHASSLYREMRSCERFGLFAGEVNYDFEKMTIYKEESAHLFRKEVREEFQKLGITLIHGKGKVSSFKKVEVTDPEGKTRTLETKNILLATGAAPRKPDIPGIDLPEVLTSVQLLAERKESIDRLVIMGGGVIGVELATVFNAIGTEVTIVEASDRLLAPMDREISESLTALLTNRGIKVCLNSKVEKIEKEQEGLSCLVHMEEAQKEFMVKADNVLVSVGRKAYTEGLFENYIPIRMEHGAIYVDDNFKTTVPNVYAIGDVTGGVQLAHVAAAQGKYVVEKMMDQAPSVRITFVPHCSFQPLSVIPSCIYVKPEIASVGLTEDEAVRRGIPVRCGKYVMEKNGMNIITRGENGFIKVVFSADSDALLGAQMMCPRATDMIGEMATAIVNNMTSGQLLLAMRAHPTYNEAIGEAVMDSRR